MQNHSRAPISSWHGQIVSHYMKSKSFYVFLADRKEFTESPIPGYTGYVPKKQEYELGSTYGTWSGKAYVDALATKKMQENTSMLPIEVKRYTLFIRAPDLFPSLNTLRFFWS